ncbi:MAG: methyltransferase domain-containing protein [Myxococcales bacterium]|nr:methyltransferase domain-containing protein [Myxococcales bacterium]
MRSAAAPVHWTLVRRTVQIEGETYAFEALPSFERASAEAYRQLSRNEVRTTQTAREDLSPMFGVIWGSARVLARRLHHAELDGVDALELGCGLALPAWVAARRGATVLATDQHPDAGPLLARNLARNGLQDRVRFQTLDWRRPGELPRFERVWASDVLFSRELPALVARTFARTLAPHGVGWLADPGRTYLPELQDACAEVGLAMEVDVDDDGAGTEAFVVTLTHQRRALPAGKG